MKRTLFIVDAIVAGMLQLLVMAGCSQYDSRPKDPFSADSTMANGMRLIVMGTVMDANQQPLQGIRIDVYGVRAETEPDIQNYNFAYTDSVGRYVICRYRGRTRTQMIVVASDPEQRFREQERDFVVPEYTGWISLSSDYTSSTFSCDFVMTE